MAKYIPLDAVVAEIEKIYEKYNKQRNSEYMSTSDFICIELRKLLSSLDSLEVKEIDLENEIKEEYLRRRCYGGRNNMLVILNEPEFNKISKHFFKLGTYVNSTGVKEMDLEKEISFQWSKFCLNGKDKDSFVEVAKHFFELGLKAQKGE